MDLTSTTSEGDRFQSKAFERDQSEEKEPSRKTAKWSEAATAVQQEEPELRMCEEVPEIKRWDKSDSRTAFDKLLSQTLFHVLKKLSNN